MERNGECHNVLVYSKWKETATVTVLWFTLNGKKQRNVTMFWFTLNGKKQRMSQCFGLL